MRKAASVHLRDGSVTVDLVEAFGNALKEFPDRPQLVKLYAEMLLAKKRTAAAIQRYDQAARLFLDAGRLFQAWMSKTLQWRIERPSREQFLEFHRILAQTAHNGAPVDHFIKNLTPAERMATFSQFRRRVAPAGKVLLKAGECPLHLYIVASGVLRENTYQTVSEKPRFRREASRILWEADCFGDIYPFSERIASRSDVVATTRVEVVMISRQRLMHACSKYPNVENGIIGLCRIRSPKKTEFPSNRVRKGQRYSIPARLSVSILPNGSGEPPMLLEGYSRDLSMSGVSFILEANGPRRTRDDTAGADDLLNREVRVAIPAADFSISISGRIVRTRPIVVNGRKAQALGIQFAEIPPRYRGAFFMLAECAGTESPAPL